MVSEDDAADVLVVNTCTVTARADRKSRQTVYQASGRKPLLTVATGCSVEQFSADYASLDGVIAVPNAAKSQVFDIVDSALRGETVDLMVLYPVDASGGANAFGARRDNSFAYRPAFPAFRTRASIKIADGCSNACSFCIIPRVRGAARSRPLDDILGEAEALLAAGIRELVLTGVNMSRYDHDGQGFGDVLNELLNLRSLPVGDAPDYRVRISSIEPDGLDDAFLQALGHPRMAPHLHLCLQSGSSRVLLAMRRMYTREGYDALVHDIRVARPDIDLTTDILVGFPGETEEDFQQTLDAVDHHQFSHVHAFPYSVRNGTRAARMPGKVPGPMIRNRMTQLAERAEQVKRHVRAGRIGTVETVLVEGMQAQAVEARGKPAADHSVQLPRGIGDHYLHVRIREGAEPHSGAGTALEQGASALAVRPGDLLRVRITGISPGPDPDALGVPVLPQRGQLARQVNRTLP